MRESYTCRMFRLWQEGKIKCLCSLAQEATREGRGGAGRTQGQGQRHEWGRGGLSPLGPAPDTALALGTTFMCYVLKT